METKQIQESVCKWLAIGGNEAICENYGHCWEMDIAVMSKGGMVSEFEVKISRADFIADKKRKAIKFAHYEIGNEQSSPNYFSYVCPVDLIKVDEIPKWAGLYYCVDGEIKFIKGATRIHRAKANKEKVIKKMLRLNVQRKYLGGSMMTYLNKESVKKHLAYEKQKEETLKLNLLTINKDK